MCPYIIYFTSRRHTYNTEKRYEMDDFMVDDDFIASDGTEERNTDDEKRKHSKRKKRKIYKKKVKKIDSDGEENDQGNVSSDIDENNDSVLNNNENCNYTNILHNETPLSQQPKKIFPKRVRNKQHEKSLEKLRKSRENKMNQNKDDEEASSSDEGNWDVESDLHSVEDFIINDEDESNKSENENLDVVLKDVIAGLKKNTEHFKQVDNVLKKGRRLLYDSTSSSDEISDCETNMSEIDKKVIDLVTTNDIIGVTGLLKDPNLVNKVLTGNKTALHIAAECGHVEMTELLVSHSANMTMKDNLLFTPLGYAAKYKHPLCFKLLLEKAELVTFCRNLCKNFNGMNLLHLIVSESLDTRECLVADIVACLEIVYSFNRKMFRKFLAMSDDKSHTPLRIAIMQDQVEVSSLLLLFHNVYKFKTILWYSCLSLY